METLSKIASATWLGTITTFSCCFFFSGKTRCAFPVQKSHLKYMDDLDPTWSPLLWTRWIMHTRTWSGTVLHKFYNEASLIHPCIHDSNNVVWHYHVQLYPICVLGESTIVILPYPYHNRNKTCFWLETHHRLQGSLLSICRIHNIIHATTPHFNFL